MKTFSAGPGSGQVDRSRAWSWLVTNLLVLPGLGSVMGGRKCGYGQMLLALAGFVITLVALIRVVMVWAQEDFQLPQAPGLYRWAIAGVLVFLVAWFWSLVTSLCLFRNSR